ncbi:MAG: AbrB family transcriptional regulator [Hyphomicrobiales bacterium]|nr:AbrB family transcriptional regulator [Hyphomicrobiales bacterium]
MRRGGVYALMTVSALAGGAGVAALGVPAGWLSGSMFAVALLALAGKAAQPPEPVRWAAMIFSGLAIGTAVTPAMMHSLSAYPLSLALMAVGVTAATFVSAAILRARPGWNRQTAFFASIPGALSFVFAVATNVKGVDLPRMAVVQVSRVFLLMGVAPLVAAETGAHAAQLNVVYDSWPLVLMLLPFAVAAGYGLERLGLAAGLLFGAMFVSGIAHATGFAAGRAPPLLTAIAQMCIGAWVGARFSGFKRAVLQQSAAAALASFVAALALSAMFAGVATAMLGKPFAQTLLAFAPGGLEAMTLLAFALGVDPVYVGAHHLARFFLISFALPLASRFYLGDDDPLTHSPDGPAQ